MESILERTGSFLEPSEPLKADWDPKVSVGKGSHSTNIQQLPKEELKTHSQRQVPSFHWCTGIFRDIWHSQDGNRITRKGTQDDPCRECALCPLDTWSKLKVFFPSGPKLWFG